MRNWQTVTGGAVWIMVATIMASVALQPVEPSAASSDRKVELASLCKGGGISAIYCKNGRL